MILVDNREVTNPYINLAMEEFLIRQADCSQHDYVLFYVNEPCIVLGKNQSIYREVNFDFLRNSQLKLSRRISGGGTVYQDEGNLSFAFISRFEEHKVNNYACFNQPVVEALNRAGVPAVMDARNNILCEGKKISGNAQFTNRKNILSHGTLLVNANLPVLRSCLKPNLFPIETIAVSSVSSSVMNLSDYSEAFQNPTQLKQYLCAELNAKESYRFNEEEWKEILKLAADKFETYSWIYGRSPVTYITKGGFKIKVEEGIIEELTSDQEESLPRLTGIPYTAQHIKKALGDYPKANELLARLF